MKIRLIKRYSTYRPGAIVDCDDPVAVRLIADGIAEREQQKDLLIETATVEPVTESADATPRRRGRPPRTP